MSEELTPMDRMELWMSALNEAITNGTENTFMPYNRYELWMKKLCEAILAKDPADPDVVEAFVNDWLDDHPEATTTVQDDSITRAKLKDAALVDIAGEYSSSATYAVGDYVFHSGALYRCVSAITTAEAWTEAHWEQVALANEVSNVTDAVDFMAIQYDVVGGLNNSGVLNSGATTYRSTGYIPISSDNKFKLIDVFASSSFLAYAFYTAEDSTTFISGQGNVEGNISVETIPASAKYVRFSSALSRTNGNTYYPHAYLFNITEEVMKKNASYGDRLNELEKMFPIKPIDTSFFKAINYFDDAKTTYYTDRYCNATGLIVSSSSAKSIAFPVEPSTTYIIYVPDSNRGVVVESASNSFELNTQKTPIYTGGHNSDDKITFTTGSTAKYVLIYFNSGAYDYDTKKSDIVLNKNVYTGATTPYIGNEYLPFDVRNPLQGTQVLVFGDSITDTCNFTINSSDQTTAMTWKNPSNSYVDAGGTTVSYSMWAKILKDSQDFKEIRNYARSGASYKTAEREVGEERQNLQYQITVALNDKNNPNEVFEVDNFVSDIVIFALGTNDGTPNDTFDSAMSKTVLEEDGKTIDVDATLAALDDTKFCESARKAFMRIKQAFPIAQVYCVLPIQRADNETNFGTLREYLTQIARRYGCIIIDGTVESGITREFNTWNDLGEYLKDGLHPNDKGQNMIARMILASLRTHYIPFGTGFNPMT